MDGPTHPDNTEQVAVPTPIYPMIREISAATAQHFHIPVQTMTGASRKREFARPRQIAMYLSRELTLHSWPEIGRRFGGRDHTTVMHGCAQIARLSVTDPEISEAVDAIRARAIAAAAARIPARTTPETPIEGNDQ